MKKRPVKTGPKSGPKKKESRKTVPDSSPDPVAEQEIILELDSRAKRPDFICVTDTESEEEPEVKPAKVQGFTDSPVLEHDQSQNRSRSGLDFDRRNCP